MLLDGPALPAWREAVALTRAYVAHLDHGLLAPHGQTFDSFGRDWGEDRRNQSLDQSPTVALCNESISFHKRLLETLAGETRVPSSSELFAVLTDSLLSSSSFPIPSEGNILVL